MVGVVRTGSVDQGGVEERDLQSPQHCRGRRQQPSHTSPSYRDGVGLVGSAGLGGRPQQDLVERHPAGAGDRERDDVGDVLGGDGQLGVELLGGLLGGGVGDVVGEFGGDRAGLDDGDADVGLQLLSQGLRPAVDAPLGGGVGGVAGAGGSAGDGGDVDQISAAVA